MPEQKMNWYPLLLFTIHPEWNKTKINIFRKGKIDNKGGTHRYIQLYIEVQDHSVTPF